MAAFPTVTATISLTLSPPVVGDINTHWTDLASGPACFLGADVADGQTAIVVSDASPLAVGSTILVGNDPMAVTAISGNTLTVARYQTAFPYMGMLSAPPITAHANGAAVMLLRYSDPWTLIAQEALRPWAQQVVLGLGQRSSTFGSVASGSMA